MKLLVDMNLSPEVTVLSAAGFEAVHWSAVGAADASDHELLSWAAAHDHIVLTSDLDFGAILAVTRQLRPSVLQVRSDLLTPEAIGGAVLAAIRQAHQELVDGALLSIDAVRSRVRISPAWPAKSIVRRI